MKKIAAVIALVLIPSFACAATSTALLPQAPSMITSEQVGQAEAFVQGLSSYLHMAYYPSLSMKDDSTTTESYLVSGQSSNITVMRFGMDMNIPVSQNIAGYFGVTGLPSIFYTIRQITVHFSGTGVQANQATLSVPGTNGSTLSSPVIGGSATFAIPSNTPTYGNYILGASVSGVGLPGGTLKASIGPADVVVYSNDYQKSGPILGYATSNDVSLSPNAYFKSLLSSTGNIH